MATPLENPDLVAERVRTIRDGHVLIIELNRPDKKNAADFAWLQGLSLALGELDADPQLRVGVVRAVGGNFTAGLDLADIAPRIRDGQLHLVPDGGCDPWRMGNGPECRKPVVVAIDGICFTLGIEFALASDYVVSTPEAEFGQIEVARGIMPFGGATLRLPARIGWGEAMRWMLGAERVSAADAHRVGFVNELVPADRLHDRALEVASRIAAQAPLAVQATLANARAAQANPAAASAALPAELARLMGTNDAAVAIQAYLSGQPAEFTGK